VNLEKRIGHKEDELWKLPSERLRIETNFQGDRTIALYEKPGHSTSQQSHERFLKGL